MLACGLPSGGVYLAALALVGFRQPELDLLGQVVPLGRLVVRFSGTPSQGCAG